MAQFVYRLSAKIQAVIPGILQHCLAKCQGKKLTDSHALQRTSAHYSVLTTTQVFLHNFHAASPWLHIGYRFLAFARRLHRGDDS